MPSRPNPARPERVVILGAAGRDFHDFNVIYRGDPSVRVVAFGAAQIPDIAGRRYPADLAGELYPEGIPILDASELSSLCRREAIDRVVFAYSDVSHDDVMGQAAIALSSGADFLLHGSRRTMLHAEVPVIAVSAVRTGCGKSPLSRWLVARLKPHGLRVAVIRHPMPYGDLARQAVQRFETRADLDRANCTVEEREEYEPHLALGSVVYAGVDYERIVAQASAESDILVWDGGNNDFPFVVPTWHIVLVDALRPGHERTHYPGDAVLRMADVIVVAKSDVAEPAEVERERVCAHEINPGAPIFLGASPVVLDEPNLVRGRRVLVIEDGPTITHGGMPYGAGFVAARAAEPAEIVDPRTVARGVIAEVYRRYPHIGAVLPAIGYRPAHLEALRATIAASNAETVVAATPCDLAGLIPIDRPVVRARYEFADAEEPGLGGALEAFIAELPARPRS